jgi:hypothetical protein
MSQSKQNIEAQMAAMRAEMIALVTTAIPAAVAAALPAPSPVPAAVPAPVAQPVAEPAPKPTRQRRKPEQPAAAAPVPAQPVAEQSMRFRIDGWLGNDGQPMVTMTPNGRKNGLNFGTKSAASATLRTIRDQCDALLAKIDEEFDALADD